MHGWRARIGVIYPSAGLSDPELNLLAPEGVSFHFTRIKMRRGSIEALKKLQDYVQGAAMLLADAQLDLIAFNCTAGSLLGGKGYDQKIAELIEKATNIRATTTATAVVEALKSLGVQKVVLITPYSEELNEIETAFLEEHGFEVVATRGLGIDDPFQQAAVEPRQWYQMARELQVKGSEGYLISCAGIQVVQVIDCIEADTRLPVVTSNQALVWHCLKLLGIGSMRVGYGRLLQL